MNALVVQEAKGRFSPFGSLRKVAADDGASKDCCDLRGALAWRHRFG
jgi:hypothetical protein